MISRYSRNLMAKVWEPDNRFGTWLKIEIFACEAMAKLGQVPPEAVKVIRKKAGFEVERIDAIEKVVKHDVIAFLTAVGERVGPEARYLHLGMTSSDVLDTSLAMLLVEAAEILEQDLLALLEVLKKRAYEHKTTPIIGRTHGMHAEPMTFGLKLALWYAEMERNLERLRQAKDRVGYGKISGAVGTFAHLSPAVEAYVCRKCGLKAAPISSQIIQRDRHAEFFTTLALIGSSIEKIAVEIRHLQRTEVSEAEEPFTTGQKGILRHAPQEKPDRLGKPGRSLAGPAGECPGGHGKRGPLARAGHQPFVRGAGDRSGQHHPAGLHVEPPDPSDRQFSRVSREHESEPGKEQRIGFFGRNPAPVSSKGPEPGRELCFGAEGRLPSFRRKEEFRKYPSAGPGYPGLSETGGDSGVL